MLVTTVVISCNCNIGMRQNFPRIMQAIASYMYLTSIFNY